MNQQTHFSQLKTVLQDLYTTFEDGLDIASPDLTSVVTNTSDTVSGVADVVTNTATIATNVATTNSKLDILNDCVDEVNGQLQCNVNALGGVMVSRNSGNLDDGVQRVCIATNDIRLTEIQTNTNNTYNTANTIHNDLTIVTDCVDQVNHHLEVDTNAINGIQMAADSGNLSGGVQRVCIATNDVNISAMAADMDTLANRIEGVASGYVSGLGVVLRGIKFGAGDEPLNSAAGNYDVGTLRVCIATDDVNISAIKLKIDSMQTDINTLATILNDVWDSVNHKLKVDTT